MSRSFTRVAAVCAAAVALIVAGTPAVARPYVGVIGDLTMVNCGGATAPAAPGVGGACFPVPAGKRFASVTITDAHGEPTTGEVLFRNSANTTIDGATAYLCGSRTVPVPDGAATMNVYVTTTSQAQACGLTAAPGTTGDVSVSFLDSYTFTAPAVGTSGRGSPNVTPVANVPYKVVSGWPWPGGTDLEFATLDYLGSPRRFAIAGSYQNGMQVVDVSDPTAPVLVSTYDCSMYQADVQIFGRDGRTYVAYAVDDYSGRTNIASKCFQDLGFEATDVRYGTFIIDITNPAAPQAISFVPLSVGSHNTTIHPGGRYLYSSNADLGGLGTLEIVDLADLTQPALAATVSLDGSMPAHDITFDASGNRAYVAALTTTLILDTANPASPTIVGRIYDPTINIHHQSDPVTIDDPVAGQRTFVIINDELAGAEGNVACPGGGLHIYDVTGSLEATPVKVGLFALPETDPAVNRTRCTAHVLRIYPDQKIMTIAWYDAGVRVLDLSGLVGISAGTPETGSLGAGIKQIGWYAFDFTDTWAVKAPADGFEPDGSFYMYGNDQFRGLDVYRFDASAPSSTDTGTWLTPSQAAATIRTTPGGPLSLTCALK